jgi:hypothetical protein
MTQRPSPTPGAKMQYLIKRRPQTSREELIAHWFANQMPSVIARNAQAAAEGKPSASHYVATLFDEQPDGPQDGSGMAWDGIAQLWYPAPLPFPSTPSGQPPRDTFQEKVEPYWPWATQEYVAVDGALPLNPPTLNPPFPCTRSGFVKQVSLVPVRQGVSPQALFDHWLDVHLPNVVETLKKVGGFRYVVSLSLDVANAPYAGIPELYFPDRATQKAFWAELKPDGFQDFADAERTLRFRCGTEMVGVE